MSKTHQGKLAIGKIKKMETISGFIFCMVKKNVKFPRLVNVENYLDRAQLETAQAGSYMASPRAQWFNEASEWLKSF